MMQEKILTTKKNGMAILMLIVILYAAALFLLIYNNTVLMGEMIVSIICVALLCIGWIPLIGLKVLKPQEALTAEKGKKETVQATCWKQY